MTVDASTGKLYAGDVYRGTNYPAEYQGSLFVNDLGQGIVRAASLNPDGSTGQVRMFATGANIVVQMTRGPDGNMYFVDLNDNTVGRWGFVRDPEVRGMRERAPMSQGPGWLAFFPPWHFFHLGIFSTLAA